MSQNNQLTPKVSVVMITYNHEKFIAQAIEGVLMQKADFPFELVIGEDCSTDQTRSIVLDYQKRYPGIIRALTPKANLGVGRNVVASINACRGDYIAFCEGDDHWTSPDKLAKQVELMETQPEAAFCFHRVNTFHDSTGEDQGDFPNAAFHENRISQIEIIRKNWIATCSALFRRKDMPVLDDGFAALQIGDWALFILSTRHGYAAFIDEAMARYRIHGGGVWSSGSVHHRLTETVRTLEYVLPMVKGRERLELRRGLGRYCLRAGTEALRNDNRPAARRFLSRSFFHYLAGRNLRLVKHMKFIGNMYFPSIISALRGMKQFPQKSDWRKTPTRRKF